MNIQEILSDSHVWLVFSFLIFAGIVWKFGLSSFFKMLDAKIAAIRSEVQNAENLKTEAQEMLAQYQRKHRDAEKEAERILAKAEKQADDLRKQAEKELDDTLALRERQLEDRLERMKQNAKEDIRQYAAQLALAATTQIITDKLDKSANDRLVTTAIGEVSKSVH